VRVTSHARLRTFVDTTLELLEGEKATDAVVLKAMGRAISKAVALGACC
jgi:DNA-binding protein